MDSATHRVVFEGYMAAISHENQRTPEIVLDNGRLILPDDRVLIGDFSITFKEGVEITYCSIKKKGSLQLKLSPEPYLFYGYI